MSYLSVSLLGPPHIIRDGTVIDLPTRKATALLAYLLASDRPQPREHLAALFWPESDQQHARGALRYTLAALRHALGSMWFDADRLTIGISQSQDLRVDLLTLRRVVAMLPLADLPSLAAVASLHRGEFLSGLALDESEEFAQWHRVEREHVQQALSKVFEALVAIHRREGELAHAIDYAQRWLALDMWHEPTHCCLIDLYDLAGQRTEAIRQYETCVQLLDEMWGIQPSDETQALYERILQRRHMLAQPAAPLPKPASSPHLPTQTTSFISRVHEQAQILGHLRDPRHRLVTLVGPGGIGKTRLAIQVAQHALDQGMFADGVYFVDLVGVASGAFLAATIASAIGCPIQGAEQVEQQMLEHMRVRHTLLLLDNFEHLIETGLAVIERMLRAAPHVQLLATSRESFGLMEEWLVEIRGLSYPDPAVDVFPGGDYDAVQLFIDRARQVQPDFSPGDASDDMRAIWQICQQVEGMPLGIELASTWVRLLPCPQIAHELRSSFDFLNKAQRNRPERHQGLRAMFAYSWRLLKPDQQRVLAQISVFRGGFTRDAVAAVTQADLGTFSALMDKSLLRRDSDGIYSLHEMLRQFAFEQLQCDLQIETDVRDRHAHHYGAMVSQQSARWDSEQMMEACHAIRSQIDNVRDGWMWAHLRRDAACIRLYVDSLFDFYTAMSWFHEARDLFAYALEQLDGEESDEMLLIRAQIYARHARFCQELGLFDQVWRSLEQSLALLKRAPNPDELAFVYEQMGMLHHYRGESEQACELLRISLGYAQGITDLARKAHILLSYGSAQIKLGDYAGAERCLRDAQTLYQRIQKPWGQGYALRFQAICAQARGDMPQAKRFHQHSLVIFQDINNEIGITLALASLGAHAYHQQQYEESYRLYLQALTFAQPSRTMFVFMQVLFGMAQLLADPAAAIWQSVVKTTALKLLAYIAQQSSAPSELRDRARDMLVGHAADLPADQLTVLYQQAKQIDAAVLTREIVALELRSPHTGER